MIISFIINIGLCYFIAYKIARIAIFNMLSNYPLQIRDNIAMAAGICLFAGLNYFGQRYLIFRSSN